MFYFFSSVILSVSEESRSWQTRPFAFAQGDMSKHDIVKVVTTGIWYTLLFAQSQAAFALGKLIFQARFAKNFV